MADQTVLEVQEPCKLEKNNKMKVWERLKKRNKESTYAGSCLLLRTTIKIAYSPIKKSPPKIGYQAVYHV